MSSSRITRATMIPSKTGAKLKRFYSLNSTGLTHAQSAWNTFMRFAREEFASEFAQINREIPTGVHRNTLYSLVREHYETQYKTYLELYDDSRPDDGVDWWKSTVKLMKSIRFSPVDYINKQKHLEALAGAGVGARAGAGAGAGDEERIPSGFFIAEGLDLMEDDDVVMGGTNTVEEAVEETHEMILGGVRYEITSEQLLCIYNILGGSSTGGTSPPALLPPCIVTVDDDDDDDDL